MTDPLVRDLELVRFDRALIAFEDVTTEAIAGHVPYLQHRVEILDQTQNFLWWELDLTTAAH